MDRDTQIRVGGNPQPANAPYRAEQAPSTIDYILVPRMFFNSCSVHKISQINTMSPLECTLICRWTFARIVTAPSIDEDCVVLHIDTSQSTSILGALDKARALACPQAKVSHCVKSNLIFSPLFLDLNFFTPNIVST